jgi:hypothetical protein
MAFDEGELAGISTKADTKNKLYATVLCEGCGSTQVDHLGDCIHHKADNHDRFFKRKEEDKWLKSKKS